MGDMSIDIRNRDWYWWVLVAVLLLAFVLRVWGLDFGLPARYHPDESKVVRVGVQALSGDWRPTEYMYPGFFKHIIAVVDVIWHRWLGLFGQETPSGLGGQYVSVFYYLARYLSAASGLLSVALMAPLTQRLFGRLDIAVLATLFMAAAYLAVRESHYAVTDMPAVLFMLLTLYAGSGIMRFGRWRDYLLAGFFLGLATATKYSSVLAILPLGMAHLVASRPGSRSSGGIFRWVRWLLEPRWQATLALICVAFLAAAPYTVIDWPDFVADIQKLSGYGYEGKANDIYFRIGDLPVAGWIFYFYVLAWGVGIPLAILSIAGLVWSLLRRNFADWYLLVLSFGFYVYMSPLKLLLARYLLLALPALLILAARLLVELVIKQVDSGRMALTLTGLGVILIAWPTISALRYDALMSGVDTRVLAYDWFVANVPHSSVVAVERYSIEEDDIEDYYEVIDLKTRGYASRSEAFYRDNNVRYVVISSFVSGRMVDEPAAQRDKTERLNELVARADLVFEAQPYRKRPIVWEYDQLYGPAGDVWCRVMTGPLIQIYRLPEQD